MNEYQKQFTRPKHNIFLYALVIAVLGSFTYIAVIIYKGTQTSTDDVIASISDAYVHDLSIDSSGLGSLDSGANLETQDDPFFGSREAKVRIVEFGDFECPFCNQELTVIKQLQTRYGNQIFFQFRDFPVVTSHPNAFNAAIAATCAYEQGNEKFWLYHDRLYQFQDSLSDELYASLAQRIGLDIQSFTSCYSQKTTSDEVEQDYLDGLDLGVTGTPTFFINGSRVPGAIPFDIFVKVIDKLLDQPS